MLESWVLVAWLFVDPANQMSLGTFASEAACEERVLWLSEPSRKKSFRRTFLCVEVPAQATCEEPAAP